MAVITNTRRSRNYPKNQWMEEQRHNDMKEKSQMPPQACARKWKYCESGHHRVKHAEARDSYCSEPSDMEWL